MNRFLKLLATVLLVGSVVGCGPSEPRLPDLPSKLDRWVSSITLDPDSKVKYIGRSKDLLVTTVSSSHDLKGQRTIAVGDVVNGVRIGAIKCSFHRRDASYAGQFMWRGRWACMAGRNRFEVENAVDEDGGKQFDYIHIAPVTLD